MEHMMKQAIFEAIHQQLVQRYEILESEIRPDATYLDLAVDSLALVELAIHIQKMFALNIPTGTLHDQQTIEESAQAMAALA
jgi:acyl carrier protein